MCGHMHSVGRSVTRYGVGGWGAGIGGWRAEGQARRGNWSCQPNRNAEDHIGATHGKHGQFNTPRQQFNEPHAARGRHRA
eukprot:7930649-Alexandrium_andersonii.AAC.1